MGGGYNGKIGLLTKTQLKVLKLRLNGYTQKEIAEVFGTSRGDIAIIEKRAWQNIKLAEETLKIYKMLQTVAKAVIDSGTHLVDIPRLVISAADKVKVKLRANFTRIYDEIRFKTPDCIKGTKVIKPLVILILKNGDIEVMSVENFQRLNKIIQKALT